MPTRGTPRTDRQSSRISDSFARCPDSGSVLRRPGALAAAAPAPAGNQTAQVRTATDAQSLGQKPWRRPVIEPGTHVGAVSPVLTQTVRRDQCSPAPRTQQPQLRAPQLFLNLLRRKGASPRRAQGDCLSDRALSRLVGGSPKSLGMWLCSWPRPTTDRTCGRQWSCDVTLTPAAVHPRRAVTSGPLPGTDPAADSQRRTSLASRPS